jgi:hypothetical protein
LSFFCHSKVGEGLHLRDILVKKGPAATILCRCGCPFSHGFEGFGWRNISPQEGPFSLEDG